MSKHLFMSRPPTDEALQEAIQKAAEAFDKLTPREKDSQRAAQCISFILGQTVPSSRNTPEELRAEVTSLQMLLKALKEPEETEHHLDHRIRQLLKNDRDSLIERVTGFIEQTQAILAEAEAV